MLRMHKINQLNYGIVSDLTLSRASLVGCAHPYGRVLLGEDTAGPSHATTHQVTQVGRGPWEHSPQSNFLLSYLFSLSYLIE